MFYLTQIDCHCEGSSMKNVASLCFPSALLAQDILTCKILSVSMQVKLFLYKVLYRCVYSLPTALLKKKNLSKSSANPTNTKWVLRTKSQKVAV